MYLLKKAARFCTIFAVSLSAIVQTALAGTRILDNSGALLTSVLWCFGSNCCTVTNGAFTGSVIAGTQAITMNGGWITYLRAPNAMIAGPYSNGDTYVAPPNADISGVRVPRLACTPGTQYAQTHGNENRWQCRSVNGMETWNGPGGSSDSTPTPFQLGSVTRLNLSTPAYATNIRSSTAPIISLGIPRGYPGCVAEQTCSSVLPPSGGTIANNAAIAFQGPGASQMLQNLGSVPLSGGIAYRPVTATALQNALNPATCANSPAPSWCSGTDIGGWASAAYTAASATYSIPVIDIPAGSYTYSTAMIFPGPMTLRCEKGTFLNYTGSGNAVTFGPTGLTSSGYSPLPYTVDGCTFTGGASAAYGLYFNLYLTKIFVRNTTFYNFGNIKAWNIYLYGENWDVRIDHVYMWDIGTQSFNGIYTAALDPNNGSAGDSGNSQVYITSSHIQTAGSGHGIGVYINGFNSKLTNDNIEMFAGPDIQLGGYASFAQLTDVYMERAAGTLPCVSYGDNAGTIRASNAIRGATFKGVYCNVHNTDQGTTNNFMAPTNSGTANTRTSLINTNIDGLWVSFQNSSYPVIVENSSPTTVYASNWINNWIAAGPVTASGFPAFTSPMLAWNQYTPIVSSAEGTIGSASAILRQKVIGKTVYINVVVTITSAGTGTGDITLTLPITNAETSSVLTCKEFGRMGIAGIGYVASGTRTLNINNYNRTGWITTGNQIACNGVVEMQ